MLSTLKAQEKIKTKNIDCDPPSFNESGYSKVKIPEFEMIMLARFFAPFIYDFFTSEEGQKEYEEWLKAQQKTDPKNDKEGEYD